MSAAWRRRRSWASCPSARSRRVSAVCRGGSWEDEYDFTYGLYFESAEYEWLSGNCELSAKLLATLLERARTTLEKMAVHGVKVKLHITRGEMPQAVESGLAALRLIGLDW